MENVITVHDFIHNKYRQYWEYSNKNGKNAISPKEQLPEVVRKIIFAAYRLNIKENDEHKTVELSGETAKFHAHGDSSIQDSIKAVATAYKSQKAIRLLKGEGNFGSCPGDDGAAARYTGVSGTPFLSAIYRDIPFVPMNTDDTGMDQPEYISMPLPLTLISGSSQIGTGKSCYIAEREARKVIEWIDALRNNGWKGVQAPEPYSITGCDTWFNEDNGYVYYQAVVHSGVNINDLSKRGRYDVITALPPKSNAMNVIAKLIEKLPTRISKQVIDGSGDGRPVCIILPTGYLDEKDYNKYGMRLARKEQIFIWDYDLNTMKFSNIDEIAKYWFEDRCQVVSRRLKKQISDLDMSNHKIDLIKEFADKKMINWKTKEVVDHFIALDAENGERDANLVLGLSARTFLPENIERNEEIRSKNNREIKSLNKKLKNIGDTIIEEAYAIIDAQEKFFAED